MIFYKLKNKDKKTSVELKILKRENNKRYYIRHIVICKERRKKYRKDHKDVRKIYDRNRYLNNSKYFNKHDSEKYKQMRKEVISVLGDKCNSSSCHIPNGCVDIRCLEIDHINGGGMKNDAGWFKLYKKILSDPEQAKKEYQILCSNCNVIKRLKNGECLHLVNPTVKQLYGRVKSRRICLKNKILAMSLLNGVFCKHCGCVDIRVLQIDHIHGDGQKELRKIRAWGVLRKIRNDPSCRSDYQVLCACCNSIKRVVNNEGSKKRIKYAEVKSKC